MSLTLCQKVFRRIVSLRSIFRLTFRELLIYFCNYRRHRRVVVVSIPRLTHRLIRLDVIKKCSCTWRVLSFHRSLTESALLRFNRPSRTCRADFSLFRSAAFRAGSPLISTRRKSCRLVTRSSDNVRRKPGVPTYPHLDRFPVSRDLYRQQKGFGSRRPVRDRVARRASRAHVVRSRKSEGKRFSCTLSDLLE